MQGADPSQPLLLQLLSAFNQGEKGSATGFSSATKPLSFAKEEVKRVEPLSFQGLPEAKSSGKKKAGVDSTDKHLDKANNLLADLEREEKDGFNLRESHDDDDFDMDMSANKKQSGKRGGLGQMNLNGGISKEEPSENNYDDDFDDDIEEDLPVEQHDPLADDADLNARSANVGGSG